MILFSHFIPRLLIAVLLACTAISKASFIQNTEKLIYPDGMAVKETSSSSSSIILFPSDNMGSTITSTWTILPPDISVGGPSTQVVRLFLPDQTVTVAGSTVTVTEISTATNQPASEQQAQSASLINSVDILSSIEAVFVTVTESRDVEVQTDTLTVTDNFTPEPVTLVETLTSNAVVTEMATNTVTQTVTPTAVYSTITYGSRVVVTVYQSVAIAAPSSSPPPPPPPPSSSPSPSPTPPPDNNPVEQENQEPQQQEPVVNDPPPAETTTSKFSLEPMDCVGARRWMGCNRNL